MVTSGSATFDPAATYMIAAAYRKLGVIAEDETPSASLFQDALFALNSMVKEWMATGIHVWTEEEAILFLQPGQARYLLGGATLDNCCDAYSYVLGQLSANATAGATSVTLVTSLGILAGQFFGIVLDNGATWWTTVNGAPVGNVVNFVLPLPSSASAQNYTFSYTTKIIRPLKVPFARLFYFNGTNEIPMQPLSRQEYMDLPNKTTPGNMTQFFYSPKLVSGQFFGWNVASNSTTAARLTWYRPIFDFNTVANTSDLPQEWVNAIVWNLAKEMGPEFDVPAQRWAIVLSQAKEKLELVEDWDRESEDIQFGIDTDATQG